MSYSELDSFMSDNEKKFFPGLTLVDKLMHDTYTYKACVN